MACVAVDLVVVFKVFCSLVGSKEETWMTSGDSAKLVTDCFEKKFKEYGVKIICDATVFPPLIAEGKTYMVVNKSNVDKYISMTAHEIAKRKTNNVEIAEDDPEVKIIKDELCQCLSDCEPQVKATAISATADVENVKKNTGYIGEYKGQGTNHKKTE